VRDTALTINQRDMEYQKAMMSSIRLSNTRLSTTIPGMQGHRRGSLSDEALKERKKYEEFIWLIKG
jgi:hypothetical protein